MKRFCRIAFFLVMIVLAGVTRNLHAQEAGCSPPRVLVRGEIVDEADFWEHLEKQYPQRSRESLAQEIRSFIFQKLREGSPGVELVEEGADYEYSFSYVLSLIAAGQDVEVAGVLAGEDVGFFMSSKLVQNDACGVAGNVVGVSVVQDDTDIFRTIERNIGRYGSLETLILNYENTHRVPPRRPVMEFALSRSYVSPVSSEREMEIRVRVRDCRGREIFARPHGQVVIFPRKTERGELKPTQGFPQDFVVTENLVLLKITGEQGGSVTYTLRNGLEMGRELFEVKTCGIEGVRTQEVMPPVPIAGVAMEIEPEDVYLPPGASTTMRVRLFEVTPSGAQVPLGGEVVDIEAEGLVDGSLSPQGSVKTDSQGEVVLTYEAGVKEDGVKVVARYQPEGYPEGVTEQTAVALVEQPQCWRGTVDITVDFSSQEINKSDPSQCGREESELTTTLHAHIFGELILRPGQLDEIISQDFEGNYEMTINTFRQSCVTSCRRKGSKGEVPVRPGNWESSEMKLHATLSDRNFRTFAQVAVDRHTNRYRFSCGFGGLLWKGFSELRSTSHDVCTGETREESTASLETELERFEISSGEILGVTTDYRKVSGEKVVPYSPLGGTVRYVWDFERIPCEEAEGEFPGGGRGFPSQ